MISNYKNRKAVTLVEVIIAMLLFAIVVTIGYTMLNRTFNSMERQRQSLDTLHEARDFLMVIERDLREMIEVISGYLLRRSKAKSLYLSDFLLLLSDDLSLLTYSSGGMSQYFRTVL